MFDPQKFEPKISKSTATSSSRGRARSHENVMTTSRPLFLIANPPSYSASTLSQRSQLFPEDRLNGSRSSTPSRASQGYNTSSNRFNSQVMDSLEGQNDDMIEGLSQKVRILKNVFTAFVDGE